MKLMHCKGQGLIETLITLLLISVSIIALIRFQSYLAYSNSITQQTSEGSLLAVKQIESLRDFQVLNNTPGYTSYQGIASGTGTSTGINATYTITWTVTSSANPTYKTLDVTVSWTDRYNNAQSVRLITRVAGIDPSYSSSIM